MAQRLTILSAAFSEIIYLDGRQIFVNKWQKIGESCHLNTQ